MKKLYLQVPAKYSTSMIIWTAGIKGNLVEGLNPENYARNGRIIVDRLQQNKGI